MKKTIISAVVVISGLNAAAGAVELNAVRAGDISGMAVAEAAAVPGAAAAADGARSVSSKISVPPATADWKDTLLVKFARNTGIDVVMHVLDSVDLSPAKLADNGDGWLARVDINDAEAPLRAAKLAGFRAVEAVQVNRTVYAALKGGLLKSDAAGMSEFYGIGYSKWLPESQGKAEGALRLYVKALADNDITVIKAEVKEVEGTIVPVIAYRGKEALFSSTGSAMTLAITKAKMHKEITNLVSKGAIIVRSETFKGRDEWGSAGGYILDYILR